MPAKCSVFSSHLAVKGVFVGLLVFFVKIFLLSKISTSSLASTGVAREHACKFHKIKWTEYVHINFPFWTSYASKSEKCFKNLPPESKDTIQVGFVLLNPSMKEHKSLSIVVWWKQQKTFSPTQKRLVSSACGIWFLHGALCTILSFAKALLPCTSLPAQLAGCWLLFWHSSS